MRTKIRILFEISHMTGNFFAEDYYRSQVERAIPLPGMEHRSLDKNAPLSLAPPSHLSPSVTRLRLRHSCSASGGILSYGRWNTLLPLRHNCGARSTSYGGRHETPSIAARHRIVILLTQFCPGSVAIPEWLPRPVTEARRN